MAEPRPPEAGMLRIGDEVEMRKPHACGGARWTIIRTGADIRISCNQCGRAVLLPRPKLLRAVRRHFPLAERPGKPSPPPGLP